MAWPEKLKLNKQLIKTITEKGLTSPKDVQQKTLARIYGGQDVVISGPEGCGKTTAYVLAVLNRIRFNPEGVPLVLILVPSKENVLAVVSEFERLGSNKQLSVVGLYPAPGTENQMDALAEGADIVVATPERARAIYLKLGLNLNKIELLIIDDADLIVKQGLQLPVTELANSITKCQHLVFTSVIHDKLNRMIEHFMQSAAVVEIDETGESKMETLPQLLYHVPNFTTKLNLLSLFMQDSEVFTKTAIFVNTRQTAEKIYQTLQNRRAKTVGLLNSWSAELANIASVDDFKHDTNTRVMIICDVEKEALDLHGIPFIINFEIPATTGVFINRIKADTSAGGDETMVLTFATDIELTDVKRIEQAIGYKIQTGELPEALIIGEAKKSPLEIKPEPSKTKPSISTTGDAFQQKKPENAKTYNYGAGVKAKMSKKKKHG
ncbi:MAG: DEAD/DEAH box helicase [Mucilaginibacter sp.]